MSFDRRAFLRHAALGATGLTAGASLRGGAEPPATAALPGFDERGPEEFWRAVRAQFPISRALAYFNTGGLGPAAQPALATAAETTRRLQEQCEHGHALFADARADVARFLGAEPAEIAFVRNATEGNAIVAAGLRRAPGDEIIFESHAHPGGSFPWFNQEKLRGVVVKLFEPDVQSAAGNVARIAGLLTPRTRVVQVSHVTAPTGIVMPVADIARLCRERGVWFHIDGAQSAGMFPFALRELGCESFATSGHKWIGAPHETGVLWVRRDRLGDVAPTLVGAYSGELDFLPGELRLADTALRYEYGTRNAGAVLALAAATRFQEQIGRGRIAARGRALAAQVRAGLARLPGVEILTPEAPELCASMIAFRAPAVPFDRLFDRLFKDHAMRCRPVSEQKLNAVRVSTHVFNSPAECAALVAAVGKILRTA
ncbi:MAG: aminotransferase class V-fold PLP-dependent enzyme [Verrucomicrobia bacterium]|nr:aminotransferase class V-fold PLP-dependent enzyme [Verrucomicrobiota bacterium]